MAIFDSKLLLISGVHRGAGGGGQCQEYAYSSHGSCRCAKHPTYLAVRGFSSPTKFLTYRNEKLARWTADSSDPSGHILDY